MSDVRGEIRKMLMRPIGADQAADAILEKFDVRRKDGPYTATDVAEAKALLDMLGFDVAPKPVVSDVELGLMVQRSYSAKHDCVGAGRWMSDQLDAAGLKIVRVDDE
jgi:hypothetical protein